MRNLAAVFTLGSALVALGVYISGRSVVRPPTFGERVRNFLGGALQVGADLPAPFPGRGACGFSGRRTYKACSGKRLAFRVPEFSPPPRRHTRDGDSRPVFCFPLLLLLRFVSELPIGGIPKQLPEEETSSPTGANVRRRVEGR